MQSAPNVDKNVKFPSNLILADLYTAENVMLNEDPREEIDIKLISSNLFSLFNLFYILFLSHTSMRSMRMLFTSIKKEEVQLIILNPAFVYSFQFFQ